MDNRKNPERQTTLAQTLNKILDMQVAQATEIALLRREVQELKHIKIAWQDARGAVRITHRAGRVIIWFSLLTSAIGAAWLQFKNGGWRP